MASLERMGHRSGMAGAIEADYPIDGPHTGAAWQTNSEIPPPVETVEHVERTDDRDARISVQGVRAGSVYDFHGLYRVRVRHRALDALMREELGAFLSREGKVDLTVDEGPIQPLSRRLHNRYSYDEATFVEETPSGLVAVERDRVVAEPHVGAWELLGHWVENLMIPTLVGRGACLVHASAVSARGSGFLFPAWMGSGKTHILLSALARGYGYMADDWCFVSRDGTILGYPRWLSLYDYHFRARPELRAILERGPQGPRLRRRLAVTEFADSLRGSSPLPRRLRERLRGRFFVQARVRPTQIVPGAQIVLRSKLSRVLIIVSTNRTEIEIRPAEPEEVAKRTVLSGAYERSRHAGLRLAMAYAGKEPATNDVSKEEVELLSHIFERVECSELLLPRNPEPRRLDRVMSSLEPS